jgi:hypothetical protein
MTCGVYLGHEEMVISSSCYLIVRRSAISFGQVLSFFGCLVLKCSVCVTLFLFWSSPVLLV